MKLPANLHLLCGLLAVGTVSSALAAPITTDAEAAELIDQIQACVSDSKAGSASASIGQAAIQALQHCTAAVDLQGKTNSHVKTLMAVNIWPQTPASEWSPFDRAAFQDEAGSVLRTAIEESGYYAVATSNPPQRPRYQISAKIEFQATGHGNRYLDQWVSLPRRIKVVLEMKDSLALTASQRRELTVQLGPQVRPRSTNLRNSDWFFKASETLKAAATEMLTASQSNPRLATLDRSSNGKLQINSGGYQYIDAKTWLVLLPDHFSSEPAPWQIAHPIVAQRITPVAEQLLIEPDNGDTRYCAESRCLAWIP